MTEPSRALVTGGAGFIGRAVVQRLLARGDRLTVLDDLSSGRDGNLKDLKNHANFAGFTQGSVLDADLLRDLCKEHQFDSIFHLAASINVQKSIDDPGPTFLNDAVGTFRVLEAARELYFARNGLDIHTKHFDFDRDVPRLTDRRPRVAVMSTCMVYDMAGDDPISEKHTYRPASPYAAAKIAADSLALSYYCSYRLPVTVVRPFNTYGPYQKSDGEGGVVSIFLTRDIRREPLLVKGTGEQTRDLLFVDDCADFVVTAQASEAAEGHIINAGTGDDVSIQQLAQLCRSGENTVRNIPHDHPQAEIPKLLCDASKAGSLLNWKPRVALAEGLELTRAWLDDNRWAW